MRKKLTSWKTLYLSKGGKVTLIKAVLSNIPVYYMSLLVMSRQVVIQSKRLQRDFFFFLWGGERMTRGSTWWHGIAFSCLSIRGVGSKENELMNKVLLCKWLCRFELEADSIWRQIIFSKYGV